MHTIWSMKELGSLQCHHSDRRLVWAERPGPLTAICHLLMLRDSFSCHMSH